MRIQPILMLIAMVTLFSLLPIAASDETTPTEPTHNELDAWWADLYGDDPAAANAIIKLYKNADAAVPYLKERLQPLELQADQCKRLLKELGSDDEHVWRAAWEKLDYLDPRLAIDLETLMENLTEAPARTRLVELCSDRKADSLAGKDVTIRRFGNEFNFFDGRGSWWAEHRVDRIGQWAGRRKRAWTRAARGVAILEQIGTPDAIEVLEQLSSGHPDAAPTRAATDSLERIRE